MIKVAAWNVNSINTRLEHVLQFTKIQEPDVLLLQETKCLKEKFPFEALEDCGYNIAVFGQKSYNGVAILSKYPIEDVVLGLPTISSQYSEEARYIEAFISIDKIPLRVASVYVPNGSEVGSEKFKYKLHFLEALREHLVALNNNYENILIGGDLNVAPEEIDVYNPKYLEGSIGFHIDERMALRKITNQGFVDSFRTLKSSDQEFSWWDYRSGSFQQNKGMRIDHILVSSNVCDMLSSVEIFKETRGWERPSDHSPVLCQIK